MAYSDLFNVGVWQVTPVTDLAGGSTLQVAGSLGTLRVILSRGSGILNVMGIGEEVSYDMSMLVRNWPDNTWFFTYQDAEPWMYVVVTDSASGWHGSIFRIETIIPSHTRSDDIAYHVVAGCSELTDADKVEYVDGNLVAR